MNSTAKSLTQLFAAETSLTRTRMMNDTSPIEEAIRLFTKPAPMTYADEQRAILDNLSRLRRERLEREAAAKPN
jgi:hypothetical protein